MILQGIEGAIREQVINLLKEGKAVVEFTKADGTVRTMLATRDNSLIPQEHHPKEVAEPIPAPLSPVKTENLSIVKCFDLEANGWRSFRIDSLIDIASQE